MLRHRFLWPSFSSVLYLLRADGSTLAAAIYIAVASVLVAAVITLRSWSE